MVEERDERTDERAVPGWTEYTSSIENSRHIKIGRWGQDHWSTFAYLETRAVDDQGIVDNRKMRCHPRLHREFDNGQDGVRYPTRCKGSNLSDHDDWSCLEDMVASGLVRAWFDVKIGTFFGGGKAKVQLTDLGFQVAAQLRQHRADGGCYAGFTTTPPPERAKRVVRG